MSQSSFSRRQFVIGGAVGTAAVGLGLWRLRSKTAAVGTSAATPKTVVAAPVAYDGFEDLYRASWTWDDVVHTSHARANCISACSWNVFVKDGVAWREEQNAIYEPSEPGRPRLQPARLPEGRLLHAPDVRAVARAAPAAARRRARLGTAGSACPGTRRSARSPTP